MTNRMPYRNRPSLKDELRAIGQYVVKGAATIPAAAAGSLQSIAVTFPADSFTTAPGVEVNPVVADPGQYQVCAVSPTATGFQINLRRGASGASAIPVTWTAVGS